MVLTGLMGSQCFAAAQKDDTETQTADGWTRVENKGGATLGYEKDSGVKILTVDGKAFKDMNRNGKLDPYEDWRLTPEERAKDLASQLSTKASF